VGVSKFICSDDKMQLPVTLYRIWLYVYLAYKTDAV